MQAEGRDARGHGGGFWAFWRKKWRSQEESERRQGQKGAKCWFMNDLAGYDMDMDSILSVMGRHRVR